MSPMQVSSICGSWLGHSVGSVGRMEVAAGRNFVYGGMGLKRRSGTFTTEWVAILASGNGGKGNVNVHVPEGRPGGGTMG